MIKELHTEIVSIMEELKGDGQPFADIFPYPVASPKLFPFAIIDIDTGNSQADEASNLKVLNVNFIIRCLFRQQNSENATVQRLEVLDQVLAKFTEDGKADYLNGKAIKMDIKSILPFAIDTADQPVFGFDLVLACQTLMEVT
jgi:hypothetical protein